MLCKSSYHNSARVCAQSALMSKLYTVKLFKAHLPYIHMYVIRSQQPPAHHQPPKIYSHRRDYNSKPNKSLAYSLRLPLLHHFSYFWRAQRVLRRLLPASVHSASCQLVRLAHEQLTLYCAGSLAACIGCAARVALASFYRWQ